MNSGIVTFTVKNTAGSFANLNIKKDVYEQTKSKALCDPIASDSNRPGANWYCLSLDGFDNDLERIREYYQKSVIGGKKRIMSPKRILDLHQQSCNPFEAVYAYPEFDSVTLLLNNGLLNSNDLIQFLMTLVSYIHTTLFSKKC